MTMPLPNAVAQMPALPAEVAFVGITRFCGYFADGDGYTDYSIANPASSRTFVANTTADCR